jgi:hypothetical protein
VPTEVSGAALNDEGANIARDDPTSGRPAGVTLRLLRSAAVTASIATLNGDDHAPAGHRFQSSFSVHRQGLSTGAAWRELGAVAGEHEVEAELLSRSVSQSSVAVLASWAIGIRTNRSEASSQSRP